MRFPPPRPLKPYKWITATEAFITQASSLSDFPFLDDVTMDPSLHADELKALSQVLTPAEWPWDSGHGAHLGPSRTFASNANFAGSPGFDFRETTDRVPSIGTPEAKAVASEHDSITTVFETGLKKRYPLTPDGLSLTLTDRVAPSDLWPATITPGEGVS
jgi:hypothetical protein